ncbi:hypothetical protein L2E82_40369 [Cichorium intybus]|uniref:Uncharacterized protein n=1 Tax=Cichorium intybus TaxID=13427 RepID=A0ACB9AKX9_CICIN|nr:hypothetical protein L2E82_40369 [Cichorium intybus]
MESQTHKHCLRSLNIVMVVVPISTNHVVLIRLEEMVEAIIRADHLDDCLSNPRSVTVIEDMVKQRVTVINMVVENDYFALNVITECDVEINTKPSYYVALGSDNTWYLLTERCIKIVYRTGFPNLPLANGDAFPREIMTTLLENGEMLWQKLSQSELGGIWCMEGWVT